MASLSFTWSDVWNWYNQANEESRASLEQEVLRDDWIFNLTEKAQIEALKDAPKPFIKACAKRLHPETCLKLKVNPYL